MAWQIGVDVGGTFTDFLALDPAAGLFRVAKVPSTPEDQSIGFLAGLDVLGIDYEEIAALIHGTTVATNAVLERKGARWGLVTTAGFRDVLELGRRTRPNAYGMTGSMGGTSFDVSLIVAGEPALSAEKDIAYGVPLRIPLVGTPSALAAAASPG